ncbi:MAG: CBS domain-containing protein [Acidimicrobiales bacterium]
MAAALVYASRVMGLPLLDADGDTLGRIDDVVLAPPHRAIPPRVLGFVTAVQRRRIFVSIGRVGEVGQLGIRLKGSAIDLSPFQLRPGELLVGELLDRSLPGGGVVHDLALQESARDSVAWEVATVALGGRRGPLRRHRAARVVPWREISGIWDAGDVPVELGAYRDMHPTDVAAAVRRLPLAKRRQLAEAMDDERLADLLEELEEEDQVRLIQGLDVERMAHVLEEMAPDDAADLLGELPRKQQVELLAAMTPDEAKPLRRLLRYGEKTAGGLMTPEPVVVTPATSVAEVLARLRDHELPPALAAQVFVADAPVQTPTGRYQGMVGVQRLLREPPSSDVGRCVEEEGPAVTPAMPEAEVAARLAAYNLLALPVCDADGRLLGAVSIDDVLDAVLPEGWRVAIR